MAAVPDPLLSRKDERYRQPYDTNFSYEYISIRKHIYSEYAEQFESLRHQKPSPPPPETHQMGFTAAQHDLLQQQLRIHTQMLTQTFLQTYSHPKLYPLAKQPKEMLHELHAKAAQDASFNCTNLAGAVDLITKWEQDLSSDEYQAENAKMMKFINKEVDHTAGHTRQVPRLAPRIMDLMLDSKVFMYPQYLPRMAFQPRSLQVTVYAPSEYQLIAMGLEKHLNEIRHSKKPLRKHADPIRLACKRMAKDTLHGKQSRRLFEKIKELRSSQQYNPVKYYFEHGRAPPVQQILWGFHDGKVLTPRERFQELPSGWKYFIEKSWTNPRDPRPKPTIIKPSAQASVSYLEFVREAVGEDLLLPDSFEEAASPDGSATGLGSAPDNTYSEQGSQSQVRQVEAETSTHKRSKGRRAPTNLTINVNYVFGGELVTNIGGVPAISVPYQDSSYADNVATINRTLPASRPSQLVVPSSGPSALPEDATPAINFSYDHETQSLRLTEVEKEQQPTQRTTPASSKSTSSARKRRCSIFKRRLIVHSRRKRLKLEQKTSAKSSPLPSPLRSRYQLLRHRFRHKQQKRCQFLITTYASYLKDQHNRFAHSKPVQAFFRPFHALELYTRLLTDLSMFCQTKCQAQTPTSSTSKAAAQQSQKRQRNTAEDEAVAATARRREKRQEEMLKHMLQPDSAEEANRKDATFAYNFYDKVEEALLAANRVEDCQKFNQLLKSFDPKHDKVSELYLKVEKLLLPENPDLAEVFLNFLLPAEAAELGKFFEHFMITNAANFINKLNIYFCKQPAQIRKIYACLSELAELPNVSMKKVESKIMPLLKGNQFLCDWFMQQFPQAKPPQRFLPVPETINMHEVQNNTTGEYVETMNDLLESPPQEQQPQQPPCCQLKYQNGRIFYGSKIMLPAKLSFMAASIYNEQAPDGEGSVPSKVPGGCVHAVRTQGEKLLSAAMAADSDDNDRSEEDDVSRALIIDTTADEDNSCSSMEMCDDFTLRAHAVRLNANYYASAATSTPNVGSTHLAHHPHAKKTAINFGEMSPRKQTSSAALNSSPLLGLSPLPLSGAAAHTSPQVDKRKSPTKKVRSPQARSKANLPMVVIHEHHQAPPTTGSPLSSPAIECAKRLRTLIDQESTQEEIDTKAHINIVAKAKLTEAETIPKLEELSNEADPEFLPENASIENLDADENSSEARMHVNRAEGDPVPVNRTMTPQHIITTQFDSDEDCKLDVVATLASCTEITERPAVEAAESATTSKAAMSSAPTCSKSPQPSSTSTSKAWTREEDKVILIEMKMGARDREHLIKRMGTKLKHRQEAELRARHQFLMDFLSKLQGKM